MALTTNGEIIKTPPRQPVGEACRIKSLPPLTGVIRIPGDKAITHRAVIFSSIAQGTARITNALLGYDCMASIECMRRLGAKIDINGNTLTVTGAKGLKNNQRLNVGDSGTTLRLLTGLIAGAGVSAVLEGGDGLKNRPMEQVVETLNGMGARITSADGFAPITVKASQMRGAEVYLPVAGAQLKGALMLAALNVRSGITIYEDTPTRDHSEIMFEEMSADITRGPGRVTVRPSVLKSLNMKIPGDLSGAAYFMAAATIIPGSHVVLRNVGVNPARTGIIDIINSCGGRIDVLNESMHRGEPVADIMVESAPKIKPFNISGALAPRIIDELPVLAVMACFADGESNISGASELRHKESDRITNTVAALKMMGARIEETGDGMRIWGGGVLNGGARIDPRGDHRVAMTLAVAGAASLEGVEILNPGIVGKSYPDFFKIFSGAKEDAGRDGD